MFNVNKKKNVDTIVPVAGAAIIFYYVIRRERLKLQDKLIFTAIIWLVLYLITSAITKQIVSSNIDLLDRASRSSGAGGGTVTVDVVGWSNELHEDIAGISLMPWARNDELYRRLAELDGANLKAVAIQYHSDWGESLRKALEGEWYGNIFSGTQDRVNSIINRLKNLGL